jgi:hypothetical protein
MIGYNMHVKAVVFDTENVWWEGFSREKFFDPEASANGVIDKLKKNQYITESDIRKLSNRLKRYGTIAINVLGLLGDIIGTPWIDASLEDVEHARKKMDKRMAGISQCFNPGLTMEIVKDYAREIELTEGIEEALKNMKERGIYRLATSSGITPFVYAVVKRLHGAEDIESPETTVLIKKERKIFTPEILYEDSAKLDPSFKGEYSRLSEARKKMKKTGIDPKDILYVESCEPDFEEISKIREDGGYVVAFRPNDNTLRRFYEKHGIPMLDTVGIQDARQIFEISMDPKKNIGKYCV